jgi:hypothetical protein
MPLNAVALQPKNREGRSWSRSVLSRDERRGHGRWSKQVASLRRSTPVIGGRNRGGKAGDVPVAFVPSAEGVPETDVWVNLDPPCGANAPAGGLSDSWRSPAAASNGSPYSSAAVAPLVKSCRLAVAGNLPIERGSRSTARAHDATGIPINVTIRDGAVLMRHHRDLAGLRARDGLPRASRHVNRPEILAPEIPEQLRAVVFGGHALDVGDIAGGVWRGDNEGRGRGEADEGG